jgi:hypothetical protein
VRANIVSAPQAARCAPSAGFSADELVRRCYSGGASMPEVEKKDDKVNVVGLLAFFGAIDRQQQAYLTKLRYDASASISSGPSVLATIGIGDSGAE